MATVYEKCGDNVVAIMRKVMQEHHEHLVTAGVQIQCLFANAGKDKHGIPKPSVKVHGTPGSAKVKLVTLKDRAAGNADAEIIIDEQIWERLDAAERKALFDHELEHLKIDIDGKPPIWETDDLGRPKLWMKKHDWEIWGFSSIVERNGKAAIEFQAAQNFKDKFGQLLMWAEENAAVG